jgi:hypothetical protein
LFNFLVQNWIASWRLQFRDIVSSHRHMPMTIAIHVVYVDVTTKCLWTAAANWHFFIPRVKYEYGEARWKDNDRGIKKLGGKNCSSATLSTRNPKRTDPALTAASVVRGRRLTATANYHC